MELNYFVFYFRKRYFCCSNYNVRHHDDLRKSVFFTHCLFFMQRVDLFHITKQILRKQRAKTSNIKIKSIYMCLQFKHQSFRCGWPSSWRTWSRRIPLTWVGKTWRNVSETSPARGRIRRTHRPSPWPRRWGRAASTRKQHGSPGNSPKCPHSWRWARW